jgi:hypothetical protein
MGNRKVGISYDGRNSFVTDGSLFFNANGFVVIPEYLLRNIKGFIHNESKNILNEIENIQTESKNIQSEASKVLSEDISYMKCSQSVLFGAYSVCFKDDSVVFVNHFLQSQRHFNTDSSSLCSLSSSFSMDRLHFIYEMP